MRRHLRLLPDPDDPAGELDRAVDAVGARFPAHGPMVRRVADALTWGEGADSLSQARIQDWLWVTLPSRWPEEEWEPAAVASGLLFDGLALDRYAALARSSMTADILEAWRHGSTQGARAYRAAADASGVVPLDTDALAWSTLPGPVETAALGRVERALERSIAAGELRPGSPRWASAARDITGAALREAVAPSDLLAASGELVPAVPDGARVSVADLVLRERIGAWVRFAHPELVSAWREAVAPDVLAAPEPPSLELIGSTLDGLSWLLAACRDGVMLTQAGYLPVSLMREGVERFDWWDFEGQPRSEADVVVLSGLRDVAERARLLARRGKRLATTRTGVRLLREPQGLWRAVTEAAGGGSAFETAVRELLALRLLSGPDVNHGLPAELAPVLAVMGWQAGRRPMDERAAGQGIDPVLGEWRLFGFLDEVRSPWLEGRRTGSDITSLNTLGRVSAMQLLHVRATAPRHEVSG
jgi:hypothetical protein